MLIRVVGPSPESDILLARVQASLEELGLLGHAEVEKYDTPEYRAELKIQNLPALCIEEPSINFRDMIFEGVTPEPAELTNLFISLFGADSAKKGGCGTCTSESCGTGCGTCTTC